MIKNFLSLTLVAALVAGCATVAPPELSSDNPASPEGPAVENPAERPPLVAGSERLAQWLATNRVDAASDDHSHHQHGQAPASKPQPKAPAKEHHH